MSAIAWWLIPVVATLLAIVWASWTARQRPRSLHDSSENYERFQAALARNYRPPADELTAGQAPVGPPSPQAYRQE